VAKNKPGRILLGILVFSLAFGGCQSSPKVDSKDKESQGSAAIGEGREGCKFEANCDCRSPGHTIRWKIFYCQIELETLEFDVDVDAFDQCAEKNKANNYENMSPCEKNNFWRDKSCQKRLSYFESLKECTDTSKGIPRFVEFGP
jgi:hypothetical protein